MRSWEDGNVANNATISLSLGVSKKTEKLKNRKNRKKNNQKNRTEKKNRINRLKNHKKNPVRFGFGF
jgi:hypothetical protein